MNRFFLLFLISIVFTLSSCENPPKETATVDPKPQVTKEKKLSLKVSNFDDSNQSLFHLTNANGIEMTVTNYGGIITSLKTPDKNWEMADIVLGYDNYESYKKDESYFGAIIGRYANRIAGGKFSIDGKEYQLEKNDGENSLHGGSKGYHKRSWVFRTFEEEEQVGVSFYRLSPDGEEGFPGELKPNVTYTLDNEDNLIIEYTATTDKTTVVNLTNHSYFNLKGEGNGDILGHELLIPAPKYTPIDENLIPTGIESTYKTPLYFLKSKPIGEDIEEYHPQLRFANGYDHNFILGRSTKKIIPAAMVYEPTTGRSLEVSTNQPAVQFYSGNFLDGTIIGKNGNPYVKHGGFCLETQRYPDSPNQPNFPSTVLRPGEKFKSTTIFHFGASEKNPFRSNKRI